MQIVFLSKQSPQNHTERDDAGEYPDAPKRCPFAGCHTPTAMAKHGYYSRFLVVEGFCGRIRVSFAFEGLAELASKHEGFGQFDHFGFSFARNVFICSFIFFIAQS